MSIQGQEIITLQFGHYSNFIGSHWWNLQEAGFSYNLEDVGDINHDVLFREGQTRSGEVTFTPRLVLTDLKGSLGTLPEDGGLYEKPLLPQNSLALWDQNKVSLDVSPPLEKNEFLTDLDVLESQMKCDGNDKEAVALKVRKRYNLENSVRVWSDYLRTLYHPRSLAITNEYKFEDNDRPFNCYGLGTSLWKNIHYQEDFTERIRAYMEECDNLQGFHVLLDGHDGFSGLSCGCLQYVNDEYSSKPVLAFISLPSHFPSSSVIQDSKRVVNMTLAFSSLPELSSLFCPISTVKEGWRQPKETRIFPFLNYNAELKYHSSAIMAAALETLTLGYRLRNNPTRLAYMISGLRVIGRAAVAASVTLPFPMMPDYSLLKTLEEWNGPLFNSISPYCDLEKIDLQSVVLRGVPKQRIIGNISSGTDTSNPAYSCRTVEEMMSLFISCSSFPSPTTHVYSSNASLRTYDPFPAIFNEDLVSNNGELRKYTNYQQKGVDGVPVLAGLHSSSSINDMLSSLHYEAKRINFRQFPSLSDSGVELLDWQEKLEQLLCLSECYVDSQ